MEEVTGFGMKNCLSLPGLDWKNFYLLRIEDDEAKYTYNDKYMRYSERQSIKGGKLCVFFNIMKQKFSRVF